MKIIKFLIIFSICLSLAACGREEDVDEELNRIAISATVNYLYGVLDYDAASRYVMYGPWQEESRYCFGVEKDGKPLFETHLDYNPDFPYGGTSYPYKDGYLSPYFPEPTHQYDKKKRIELNEHFYLEKIKEIRVVEEPRDYSAFLEYISTTKADIVRTLNELLPENGIDMVISPEDKVELMEPMIMLMPYLDRDTMTLELRYSEVMFFPITVNGIPAGDISASLEDPGSYGTGSMRSDEVYYDMLKEHKPFVLFSGHAVSSDTVCGEHDMPVVYRKAFSELLRYARSLKPYETIMVLQGE